MIGLLSSVAVLALSAGPNGFDFDGPTASVVQSRPEAVMVRGGETTPALGEVTLGARDRIDDRQARYGDRASLDAKLVAGEHRYEIELVATGFPPAVALKGTGLDAPPPAVRGSIGGGVLLDEDIFGLTGIGPRGLSQAHAAVAVFGTARVLRDGKPLTTRARIMAAALTDGGDYPRSSLVLFLDGLPRSAEQEGSLVVIFQRVVIDVNGARVPLVAEAPTISRSGTGGSGASASSGAGGGGTPQPAQMNRPTTSTIGGALTTYGTFSNQVAAGAQSSTASGAAPATVASNAAPVTSLNGLGTPIIGNAAVPTVGGAIESSTTPNANAPSRDAVEAATGRSNLNPTPTSTVGSIFPQGNGIPTVNNPLLAGTTPSAPVAGTPGAPVSATPGGFGTQTPGSPLAVAATPVTGPENQAAAGPGSLVFPTGTYPGTAQALSSQTTVAGRDTGSAQFSSSGIPLTPAPANETPATPLPQTPSPLNAQPIGASIPQTPSPLTQGTVTSPAVPGAATVR